MHREYNGAKKGTQMKMAIKSVVEELVNWTVGMTQQYAHLMHSLFKHISRSQRIFNCMKLLFYTVLILSINSCNKLILASKASHARELKVFQKDEKKIVFVGMTHISKPQFFNEVKYQIDSLRQEGFVFFKEGVRHENNMLPQTRDTLTRKFRQLMGFTIGDYTNKNNKSLPKHYRNKKYIMQRDSIIGLTDDDFHVDMTYNDMIKTHEEKYGTIKLTTCDFETPIFEKYKCRDGNAYKKNFYVVDIARTDFLVEEVLASKHQKIAIVYGAGHLKWIYPKMLDSGYVYKNKRIKFG